MPTRASINLIKKPKNYSWWLSLFLLLLILLNSYRTENLNNILSYTVILILAEILVRISQCIEYFIVFYGKTDNYSKVFRDIFNWENTALFAGAITLIAYALFNLTELYTHENLALLFALAFTRACNFNNSRYMKKIWIENSDGLDYGSGMAYSYFYGYLNIILPNKGDNNLSLKELMNRYEASEHVTIAKHKLFVLIDKNLYISPDLSQMSNKGEYKMESCKTMIDIYRCRAGCKDRSYKNTVYKIQKINEEPYYVVAEGATPLLTLYETMNNRGEDHRNQDSNIDEIVSQFYRTLENSIQENIDCRGLCELIYFDSDETKDVGELLYNKIRSC